MLRQLIGDKTEKLLSRLASFLHQKKITPNMLTLTGLLINVIGAYCYANGFIVAGGLVIILAGLFDMLDGAVARAGNIVSKLGAFTDSVVDRYSDFIIFSGVLAWYARAGDVGGTFLVLIIITGAFLVSYVRARAELVIDKCAVGFMERPERIIILAAGSLFNFFTFALWFLAIATHLTALYRIYYTCEQSQNK